LIASFKHDNACLKDAIKRSRENMKKWRVIDTGKSDCHSNMAIDEALFQAHDAFCHMPVLRIYRWNPAAFSIGISQDPAIELDLRECEKEGIGFVRRMTGGGVIFHDQELTYSIICSESDIIKPCFAKETYKLLCSFLIDAYRALGLKAEFALAQARPPKQGWVCFKERERYDILINGNKIGGNAQRRKRGLIFQHGSIPLKSGIDYSLKFLNQRHALAENRACSLSQALDRDIGYSELKKALIDSFKTFFNVGLVSDTLNHTEENLYDNLLQSKYRTKEWNLSRYAGKYKASVA
jgi:lipoyl(octanoyl) transferase